MPPMQVILSLVGIIIIIAGAYYATYYIGLKASGKSSGRIIGKNRYITLLERFSISKDKSFCIVEIAGKVYFIGISNHSMSLLDTLDAEEFAELAVDSYDTPLRSTMPGGLYGGKYVGKLAAFMARKMGRTSGASDDKGAESESFAEKMRAAHEKNTSGRPGSAKAERPDSSEGE